MTTSDDDVTTTFHLVKRAKEGEEEALGRLFDRYYKRVSKIVSLRLGNRLRGVVESEDILQETFLGAVKSFDQFELRNDASVINWLSRIAERAILNAAQHYGAEKRNAAGQVSMDGMDGQEEVVPKYEGCGPETAFSDREEAGIVDACIGELPEDYREIIVLRDYVGYSWAEVAAEHGRPSEDAARMMHAKALLKLHKLIEERFPET